MHQLTEREEKILEAVVVEYIQTAGPVGSQAVVDEFMSSVSPATVRNEMAILEQEGFLHQPHTSAGRVPTETGFRYYIESLIKVKELTRDEKRGIESRLTNVKKDFPAVIREACRVLSGVSRYAGVVLAPRLLLTSIKKIEFVSIGSGDILVIFIAETGFVYHKVVRVSEHFEQRDLNRMSSYVNGLLTGLPLSRVRDRIKEEMRKDKVMYDNFMKKALDLSRIALREVGTEEIYVNGQVQILEQPEFADVEKMKNLFRALEDKKLLLNLLDEVMPRRGIKIFFGTDTDHTAIQGMTLVAATYGKGKDTVGSIGVLGPIRMDYSRVIPLVKFTSNLLNAYFAASS